MHKKNISDDRKKYLRKKHIKKISILIIQISILIAFIAIWEMAANKGLIDSFIMSKPSKILKTFINLSSNDLLMHIRSNLPRNSNRIFTGNWDRNYNCNITLVVRLS